MVCAACGWKMVTPCYFALFKKLGIKNVFGTQYLHFCRASYAVESVSTRWIPSASMTCSLVKTFATSFFPDQWSIAIYMWRELLSPRQISILVFGKKVHLAVTVDKIGKTTMLDPCLVKWICVPEERNPMFMRLMRTDVHRSWWKWDYGHQQKGSLKTSTKAGDVETRAEKNSGACAKCYHNWNKRKDKKRHKLKWRPFSDFVIDANMGDFLKKKNHLPFLPAKWKNAPRLVFPSITKRIYSQTASAPDPMWCRTMC